MSPINDYESLLSTTEGASETGKKKGLLWMVLVMAACLASFLAGRSASSIGEGASETMLLKGKGSFGDFYGAAASETMLKDYPTPCFVRYTDLESILDSGICTHDEAFTVLSCGRYCLDYDNNARIGISCLAALMSYKRCH
eukprot:CAMPEP_0171303030 /NCGR_PEP_ID=MMETSP0816-20121228/12517_1 /TAXON_ID=420281 /ORGANISM="Proboscia inermis, Strain CCAP1064/1" /LENGTH=140 /DNA_ID=CAMNT_0011781971 /DNA_START=68 /DNA_END=490 /DNA_ORIENTATION=+